MTRDVAINALGGSGRTRPANIVTINDVSAPAEHVGAPLHGRDVAAIGRSAKPL
jgi:hypothetical protein